MAQRISDNDVLISFYFRNSKASPSPPDGFPKGDKLGIIYIKIRYKGKRTDIGSTQVSCWRSQWVLSGNPKEPGRVVGEAPYPATETAEANGKIGALFGRIRQVYAQLRFDPQFNAQFLKGHVLGNKEIAWRRGESTEVKSLVDAYIAQDRKRFEAGEIAKNSIRVRENYVRIFHEFIIATKRIGLEVCDITHETFDAYKFYLLKERKYNPAYVAKNLQYVRQSFRWGQQNKIIISNPLSAYIIRKCENDPDTTHLDKEDLDKLIEFNPYDLSDEGKLSEKQAKVLDEIRDMLVFMSLTGMHHGDYKAKDFEIIQDKKTGFWLKGKRQKTKSRFEVPLDRLAMRIIRKYGGIEKLPARSNKTDNHYLKILAILVGITSNLTTKIGRKTFADRALNDMDMETIDVAAMLGHSDTKYLKHYARIQNRRLMGKFVQFESSDQPEGIRRLPVDSEPKADTSTESVLNKWMA